MQMTTRRNFLLQSTCAISSAISCPIVFAKEDLVKPSLFTSMGIGGSIANAALLKKNGAEFITEKVDSFLCPSKDEAAFAKNLEQLKKSPLPVLACNAFIRPSHLRAVGEDATHDQIMEWSLIAFRRMKQAGGKLIVFGSGGARKLRNGWPKEKADKQFVDLLKLMGPAAAEQGITVVVEQLRDTECNYINHIGEAAALIRKAAHPNIRLLADFFHMARMGDTPEDLRAAMDVVVHIEIAEKERRAYPGVKGDDFRPYFRVLREAGYQGAINIEGIGTIEQLAPAFAEITKQASEV
jgi:sugar phosphate isomerase/epimerase